MNTTTWIHGVTVAILGLLLMTPIEVPAAESADEPAIRPVVDSPLFPFTFRRERGIDDLIREIGFSDYGNLFTRLLMTEVPPYKPDLEQVLRGKAAKGPGVLWLAVSWDEKNPENRAKLIETVRHFADLAQELGWIASIYPHTGDTIDTAREALPLVEEINHPNLGLTLNMAHELRNEKQSTLTETVEHIRSHLNAVTINGADAVPQDRSFRNYSWDQIIQPLGEGSYDPLPLLRLLRDQGYTGPIGLQCYRIKRPPSEYLPKAMQAWENYMRTLYP